MSRRAVVLGGGMAGLLTAGVLAEHMPEVVVVERDWLPQQPAPRPGTPQSRHVHILLARGLATLEGLLPGFTAELVEVGAPRLDLGSQLGAYTGYGWAHAFAPLEIRSCSRAVVEWLVRRRVGRLDRVRVLDGHQAIGLCGERRRITGVTLLPRGTGGAAPMRVDATLVVDATGRAAQTARWLADLGLGGPREIVVDPRLGYATCLFDEIDELPHGWRGLYLQSRPGTPAAGGVLLPVEDGRWIVTLAAGPGRDLPTTPSEFRAFAASLPVPQLADALLHARFTAPIHTSHATANRRRRCGRAARAGLLVVGDAACAFNPVYGQGMTVAALQAEALAQTLRITSPDHPALARRARARVTAVTRVPWWLAVTEDVARPGTQGRGALGVRAVGVRALGWYTDRLKRLAATRPEAASALAHVLHLVAPPSALARPALVGRVLAELVRASDRVSADAAARCPR